MDAPDTSFAASDALASTITLGKVVQAHGGGACKGGGDKFLITRQW
jgi:hypothetical protein